MSTTTNTERTEAIERLRELLSPGDTVHTILRHVSRSGMSRSVSLMIIERDERHASGGDESVPFDISWLAARAMDDRIDRDRGGIKISGAGMDMGFALVYNLGRTLWPSGHDCTGSSEYGSSCPSNDHSNGDRDYTPHVHSDGGYALRHRWL